MEKLNYNIVGKKATIEPTQLCFTEKRGVINNGDYKRF